MAEDRRPAPFDYDDPLFRHGVPPGAGVEYSTLRDGYRDIHPQVADGLMLDAVPPVLDMGSGTGTLGALLDQLGVAWVGVDRSVVRVQATKGAGVLGDGAALPFADGVFGAVAALYVLYHFDDPLVPMREASRVLRPGGAFVCCAPSRDNYPELARYLPPQPLDTFDAENAPELVGSVFKDLRVETWDFHAFRLPDSGAVWTHLVARQIAPELADEVARRVRTPIWVRARGAIVWARKPA